MSNSIPARNVRMKRAYDQPEESDGLRILVDRLWPRGVSKAQAAIDDWTREIAPSARLRKWFSHDPNRWSEFRRRYRGEIREHAGVLKRLRCLARQGPITLVYGSRNGRRNNAVVLRRVLLSRAPK
jgi:uncharacterized protein YeaO (DUF488 family)